MKIENLTTGMVIKNYKELCLLLELEVKAGDSKKSQIKEIERYFNLEKQGNKFLVKEVYDMPKEKIDNRGGNNNTPYLEQLEMLILDLLAQSIGKNNGIVFLSKNKLFKEFKMTNDNYAFCKSRVLKLSKFTDIDKDIIEEWYLSTDGTLKRNLEKAMDNLKKQSLIIWSSEITICEIIISKSEHTINKKVRLDEYDEEMVTYKINSGFSIRHREATTNEKKKIIHIERDIMLEMGYENKQDIVKYGLWDTFKKRVNKVILDEMNISFYYDSYKILFNEDHIQQQYNKVIDKLILDEKTRNNNKEKLNNEIMIRLKDNGEKRQNRAIEETRNWIGDFADDKLKMRVQDNYVGDNHELVNILINKDYKNIKHKIKRIKVDVNN